MSFLPDSRVVVYVVLAVDSTTEARIMFRITNARSKWMTATSLIGKDCVNAPVK
jgi:hypothetical protein